MPTKTQLSTRAKLRQTNVRLEPDVLDRIKAYCRAHPLQPARDRIIDLALKQFLDNEERARSQEKPA